MRSPWWQRIAVVLWLSVVALTAWAIVVRPGDATRTALVYEPFLAYELSPGRSAMFIVPADIERARLITRTAVPEGALGRAGDPIDYPIDVAWQSDAGEEVLAHEFWESSGVSRMPGPALAVWQNAWLTDASDAVTDDRVTLVPIDTVLPTGGYLRITAPEEGGRLYVRVYGEEIRGTVDAGLKLFGPSNQLQQGLLHRVGLPAWALLDRGERRALTRTVWKSLSPDAATREVVEPRWMYRSEVRMSLNEQRLAFQTLGARRSVAINLVGPARISLSGHSDIADLRVRWVGIADAQPVETPTTPVDFAGALRGRGFEVPPGPGSLVFENASDRPVGPFWWTMAEIGPETLFGVTEASRIASMAPPGAWTGEDVVLVGPEYNLLDAWRLGDEQDLAWSGAWPASGDVLQLLVRGVLTDPDDVRTRTLRVTGWDALGRKVWSDAAAFDPVPAPFEHLYGTDLWLSEPIVTWVPVDSRVRRLTVTSRDGLVVMLRGQGAPQGDRDFYPVPEDQLKMRYPRRPVTNWRSIDPDEPLPEDQRARVLANVRLEPAGTRAGDIERRYASLEPVDAPEPPRIWVEPLADPLDASRRALYCRYTPGTSAPFPRDAAAVKALDGVLSGMLWTSGASSLGQTFRVGIDGVTWQEGRLSQRVYSFRTGREPGRSRVTYDGPRGSSLWMRTVASPSGCPDPHEPKRYWTLDPGQHVTFAVTRTLDGQVFAVSALGDPRSQLRVRIDDGQTLSAGLHPSWTKKVRILDLSSEASSRAQPIDDPDASAEVLKARGIALSSNLAGTKYRITVENVSPGPVHVRGLLETEGPAQAPRGIEEVGLLPVALEEE